MKRQLWYPPVDQWGSNQTHQPIVHPPAVLPRPVIRLWERLASFLPFLFDPVALEFILWGTKPAPPRAR